MALSEEAFPSRIEDSIEVPSSATLDTYKDENGRMNERTRLAVKTRSQLSGIAFGDELTKSYQTPASSDESRKVDYRRES